MTFMSFIFIKYGIYIKYIWWKCIVNSNNFYFLYATIIISIYCVSNMLRKYILFNCYLTYLF